MSTDQMVNDRGTTDQGMSRSTTLWLAAAGGGADRTRIALTAIGAAVGTLALTAAVTVAFTGAEDGPYTTAVLNQPGLHAGIVVGLAALCVPLLAFAGQCARIGAPARDHRLAALRMQGATPRDVVRVAAVETGLSAGVGAVLGMATYFSLRLLFAGTVTATYTLERQVTYDNGSSGFSTDTITGPTLRLPTDVLPPWPGARHHRAGQHHRAGGGISHEQSEPAHRAAPDARRAGPGRTRRCGPAAHRAVVVLRCRGTPGDRRRRPWSRRQHTVEMVQKPVAARAPRDDEFDAWAALFRAYRVFYELTPDEAIVERVWTWIHDPDHETNALIAIGDKAQMVGLAHYRRFARPATGSVGIWLDDLMVDPEHRGNGIGRLLIDAVTDIGERDGSSIVRWITAADNLAGQRLYDVVSTKTTWITYDKPSR